MVRARLLGLLRQHSYRYDAKGQFPLASGKRSHHYVDCKATTMRGDAADLVGALIAECLPTGVTSVGGLTMGADPIAQAVASYCTRHGRPMDHFAVRKEAKRHGLLKWIEGCAEPGRVVAVVDDVVTTGGSTVDALRKCQEEGLRVAAVIVLVDRQEDGGLERIRQEVGPDIPVRAIFTLEEVAHAHEHPARPRSAAG